MIIDSHCHLNSKDIISNLDNIIDNALKANVKYMQTICTKLSEMHEIIDIIERYNNIFGSCGVHPHEAKFHKPKDTYISLIEFAKHEKIIGIGETGLDYYYLHSSKQEQKENFIKHIDAARSTKLPLIIHSRDADNDMIDILESEMKNSQFSAVLHCFSSSEKLAKKAINLGIYISISGIITFKNATMLRNITQNIPVEYLLIETDSPYLAPVPLRGKVNEPSYLKYVAEYLSDVKNTSLEIIQKETTYNFFKLFSKANNLVNLK